MLHRAIEQGHETDAVFSELVRVCATIGNHDEAVKVAQRVASHSERLRLQSYLMNRGLIDSSAESNSPRDRTDSDNLLQTGFRDELAGSFRFLFEDHMPLTVMVATLTFPLVIGLGGFLTQGSSQWLLPAIALLPVLSVIGLIGALSRKIIVEAAAGLEDPPRIPELGVLGREAMRFLGDGLVLVTIFLGPGILCLAGYMLGNVPLGTGLAAFALGALFLPMALILRQVRNDWQCLSPVVLFPAITRGGLTYLGAVSIGLAMFIPAVAAGMATIGSDLYLQISFIGPLSVAPLFVASRLTGRVLYGRQKLLETVLVDQRIGESGATFQAVNKRAGSGILQASMGSRTGSALHRAASASANIGEAQRRPTPRSRSVRSASSGLTGQVRKPAVKRTTPRVGPAVARAIQNTQRNTDSAARRAAQAAVRRKAQRNRLRAPTHPEASGIIKGSAQFAAGENSQEPAQYKRPKRPKTAALTESEILGRKLEKASRKATPHIVGEDTPDLINMPGFTVLRGEERIVAGAAAETKSREPRREE